MSCFSLKSLTRTPSTRISPEVTLSMPPSMFRTVVLPAPEGPTITQNSPFLMVKFTPFAAFIIFSPIL